MSSPNGPSTPSINGVVVTWVVATERREVSTRRGFDSLLMHMFLPVLYRLAQNATIVEYAGIEHSIQKSTYTHKGAERSNLISQVGSPPKMRKEGRHASSGYEFVFLFHLQMVLSVPPISNT
jgi:hypothetical protein